MTSSEEIRICLVGATGRMGVEVIKACDDYSLSSGKKVVVYAGLVDEGDPHVGTAFCGISLPLAATWEEAFDQSDVIIDFSSPEGTLRAIAGAKRKATPLLVCTTGLTEEHDSQLLLLAGDAPVIRASNTSVGVNVMLELVREAATMLGADFDVEMVEVHHRYKQDAPSGTALSLASAIDEVRGFKLEENLVTGRFGRTGERRKEELAVMSLRGGDVAGDHTVFFFGNGERIEITHRASNRSVFALGALRAACWLVEQNSKGNSGIFTMKDVLLGSNPV